ncbi:alpha/beta fold hydrolase [Vreelandella aquamarina]
MTHYAQQGYVEVNGALLLKNLREGACGRFYVPNHVAMTLQGTGEKGRLLFAHGAGSGQDSFFMRQFATEVAEYGIQLMTLDFAYMRKMNIEERRRPPPKVERLVDELAYWYGLIAAEKDSPLWIGGKSMGGRVASMLAAQQHVAGVIITGYPFHPPRSPDRLRLAHWSAVSAPSLILQGERDPFGRPHEVETYVLPGNVQVEWLPSGDHDLKPLRSSGLDQCELIRQAAQEAARFMRVDGLSDKDIAAMSSVISH